MQRRTFLKNAGFSIGGLLLIPSLVFKKNKEIHSVEDGMWHDPRTWGGIIPSDNDFPVINHIVWAVDLSLVLKNGIRVQKNGYLSLSHCCVDIENDILSEGMFYISENIIKSKGGATISAKINSDSAFRQNKTEKVSIKSIKYVAGNYMNKRDKKQKDILVWGNGTHENYKVTHNYFNDRWQPELA